MSDCFDHMNDAYDDTLFYATSSGLHVDGSSYYKSTNKVCKYCGVGGLTWGTFKNKWRLYKGNELHICN